MKADTWMAFYVGDYVANTLHLTTRQHGGYLLLILAAWKAGGVLPGTDAALAAIARLSTKEWKQDGDTLKGFLTQRGADWIHERVMFEWNEAKRLGDAKSAAGREGAHRRWSGRANGKPMADPLPEQRQNDAPIPSPKPRPVTTSRHVEAESDAQARDASALAAWQASAGQHGWPEVQFLNSTRRYQLRARLGECGGLEGWNAALTAAAAAEFLKNQRWFDFDWMLKPENFTRLMEGRYAERHRSEPKSGLSAALAGLVD